MPYLSCLGGAMATAVNYHLRCLHHASKFLLYLLSLRIDSRLRIIEQYYIFEKKS